MDLNHLMFNHTVYVPSVEELAKEVADQAATQAIQAKQAATQASQAEQEAEQAATQTQIPSAQGSWYSNRRSAPPPLQKTPTAPNASNPKTPSKTPNSNTKRRHRYLIGDKQKAIHLAREIGTSEAAAQLNIDVKLIRAWIAIKYNLLETDAKKNQCRLNGGGRPTPHKNLENLLLKWIVDARSRKEVVSFTTVREQALKFKSYFPEKVGFRASYTWLYGFLERNQLSYRAPTHKAQQNSNIVVTASHPILS
jgi:hypothetical protein